jgi:hypothetical protein
MTGRLAPLSEEQKHVIINEHPDGLWIVLNDEYPQDSGIAADLLGGDPEGLTKPLAPR